ncbi:MAG: 2-dehydropantoate 2-reductase [Chloroflexi bacterium]|nr:2-dehydropantoate 2-reductase [Chloroflexota bacterium]
MAKKMAVLGAGALGASIGADLTKAGYDVLLIDQWPAHIEAMKAHGLRVTMPEEEYVVPVQAFHLCEMKDLRQWALQGKLDVVFLAAKSYDTRWMVEFIRPYLKSDGVLVSVQNSLNDEWISPVIGRQRDMACALEVSAEVFEPGWVRRNTDRLSTTFVLGELDGRITPRLQEVAQVLGAVGRTQVSTNIWGVKWTKLMFNCMRATPRAAFDVTLPQMLENPGIVDLLMKLGREAARVASALGYTLEPMFGLTAEDFRGLTDELFLKLNATVVSHAGTTMIQQDIAKGRLTETDYINGLVVKKGRTAKVPTPANEAMTAVMHRIEDGVLQPSLSNLQIFEQYLSGRTATALA